MTLSTLFRRSLDDVIANWPLILVRVAEGFVVFGTIIFSILVAVVPLGIFASLRDFDFRNGDPTRILGAITAGQLAAVLYALLVVGIAVGVLIAIRSFVEAGTVAVMAEAERTGTESPVPSFTLDRWFRAARNGWWRVFLIYNVIWGVASLILLFPLLAIAAVAVRWLEHPAVLVAGCALALVFVLVALVVSLITHLWTHFSITASIYGRLGAVEGMKEGLRLFRRHAGPAIVVLIVSFVISFAVGMLGAILNLAHGASQHAPFLNLVFLPMQLVMFFVQSALGVFLGLWFTAAIVSLVVRGGGFEPLPA
ncbi:MAG: DUF4013 domain-containing protein [Thermoanaerobaculia bacterium]